MKLGDIDFDNSTKSLVPCRRCGGTKGEIHPPKGPHGNMLRCAACGHFHAWLSPSHPKSILPKDEFSVIE